MSIMWGVSPFRSPGAAGQYAAAAAAAGRGSPRVVSPSRYSRQLDRFRRPSGLLAWKWSASLTRTALFTLEVAHQAPGSKPQARVISHWMRLAWLSLCRRSTAEF